MVPQAVNGLVEGVEAKSPLAEGLDGAHHLIGIHGLLAQHEQDQHLRCRLLKRVVDTGGGAALRGFLRVLWHHDAPFS